MSRGPAQEREHLYKSVPVKARRPGKRTWKTCGHQPGGSRGADPSEPDGISTGCAHRAVPPKGPPPGARVRTAASIAGPDSGLGRHLGLRNERKLVSQQILFLLAGGFNEGTWARPSASISM